MRADRPQVERQAMDRSAAAESELQAFSYIVSHDLAASLRHVAQFSNLLVQDLGADLSDRQRAYAERIRTAADHSQRMLEQVLAYSRAQQKDLQKTSQDAAPIMRLCLLQLSADIQTAGADISLESLGEVFADADLLALAFRHLLDNALKFRQPGIAPRIRIQAAHDDQTWRVRICDNGLGVEPAYRDKAFDMFQRLGRDNICPGAGAGLTISRRIARRHGGEARFIDGGEGACIELSLPRGPAPRRARPPRRPG